MNLDDCTFIGYKLNKTLEIYFKYSDTAYERIDSYAIDGDNTIPTFNVYNFLQLVNEKNTNITYEGRVFSLTKVSYGDDDWNNKQGRMEPVDISIPTEVPVLGNLSPYFDYPEQT